MMFTLNARARLTTALVLAATLLTTAFGPPAPVGAAPEEPPAPRARLELVVKEVNIVDDSEPWISGDGEMGFMVGVWQCVEGDAPPCRLVTRLVERGTFFSAGEADLVTIDLELPGFGRVTPGQGVSRELGFPVYPGRHYAVLFEMIEYDAGCPDGFCFLDDDMGFVTHYLDAEELGVGTHTRKSELRALSGPGDFVGQGPGKYVVTYEIRRVPLPDLVPVSIRVDSEPGSTKNRVCMTIVNPLDVHAGPFDVNLSVNGNEPADGKYTVGVLGAGQSYLTCVLTTLPTSGQFELAAVVDKAGAVTEYNETNNVHRQTFTAAPPSSSSSLSQGQIDLTVSAIKVNGQAPDGKDDCKDGKNDIAVVVKNAGSAKAGEIVVRLTVDGGEAVEETLDGLEAGKEREVRFDDLRLKNGKRALVATVDAKGDITESKEDNNDRAVTAECKDDD
jgi:CARDB